MVDEKDVQAALIIHLPPGPGAACTRRIDGQKMCGKLMNADLSILGVQA